MMDSDRLRERLRTRIRASLAAEPDWTTYCGDCDAVLTEADREAGCCTNCHPDEDDEEDCCHFDD
jgi:hypothetical protein